MALAGLSACTKQPVREIYPYVRQPEEMVPGEPLYYATSMELGGFATGVLAKSREGHPIKIDGNPDHPSSMGGSSVWMQASILDLYDPDRSQTVTRNGEISTWALFLSDLNEIIRQCRVNGGKGLRFLTGTVTSPTLADQLLELKKQFPASGWHQFDPITRDNVREGARMAFGEFVETHYNFDKAAVVLSLDSDFLGSHPERLLYARQFSDGRRMSGGKKAMSRLYVAESSPTLTGMMADHRLPLESALVLDFAREIARQVRAPNINSTVHFSANQTRWLETVARDLRAHSGSSLVIAGEWQPPTVHALAHWLNHSLNNVGKTVFYTESAEANPVNQHESLRQLVSEMNSGAVEKLFILGSNPVYTAPADLDFSGALGRVKTTVHLGLVQDETAAACAWHIPQAHYLESWGDSRAFDGTVSLMQPLIAPLYNGKTACELLDTFNHQQPLRDGYQILAERWEKQNVWRNFEADWRKAIHDGFIAGTKAPQKEPGARENFDAELERDTSHNEARTSRPDTLEVCFRPDPSLWDGVFANNGWLQECPKPGNKLTWDNAILISPALAQRLKLSTNDIIEFESQGRKLRGPVWIMPGQAENSLTIHLGYGRARAGRVGDGVGINAYSIRTADAPWIGKADTLTPTGETHLLVATQTHFNLHSPERQIYRSTSLREFLTDPETIKKSVEQPKNAETLYNTNEFKYDGYKWGMSIDLTTCIGCNACLIACEVENNIPVVGKEQVYKSREMHWIRIDTYYRGSLDNPTFNHAPVPCMHCEHAPCELVCPVEATVHDSEGLNLQVYQRCVGTRFCSNNCPYKVRRFNFLRYTDYNAANLKPLYNPEVTVRWRGVMEKCSYCIQRIAASRIAAEKQNRRIREGEVVTACQQACPARAIVFGDLNGERSEVARLKAHALDYAMLGQLNVRPRTTYLAKVTNPNPELEVPHPQDELG